jgi:hypothetical protein
VSYSDKDLKPRDCSRCRGTRFAIKESRGQKAGEKCLLCDGSGLRYPLRKRALADAFAQGDLPEQKGKPPGTKWCPECRPNGMVKMNPAKRSVPLHHTCETCKGRTVIHA